MERDEIESRARILIEGALNEWGYPESNASPEVVASIAARSLGSHDLLREPGELARLRREIEAACGPIPAVDEDGDPVTYYVLATKLRRILGTEGGKP